MKNVSNGFSDDLNRYNTLRDEQRALTQKLPNVGHVDKPKLEKQILAKGNQIRAVTDRISSYRKDTLAPLYRDKILGVVEAKSAAAAARAVLDEAENAIAAAEKKCYETWLQMRNSARPSGQTVPPRHDVPGPRRHTGQISSYTPGLRV